MRPWLSLLLLLGLAALPGVTLLRSNDPQAQRSVLNVLASFLVLMFAFRVIGKRELGRLSAFELVTLMLIPEILSGSFQGDGSLLQSLSGLSTVLLLVVLVSLLSQRFSKLQRVLESPPTVLVARGRMLEDNLNRERIAPDELFSEMRKQGLDDLEKVRYAILESSGNVTFISTDGGQTGGSGGDENQDPL